MKKTGFYIIKDSFFGDMDEPYLKGNKEGNRPHYYCFEDSFSGLYWMIPLSSRINKYKKIVENKKKAGKPCDIIHIVKLDDDRESAFLIQNMFPITDEYIEREYTIAGNHLMLTSEHTAKEIEQKARNRVYQTANFAMVEAYWNIGKSIIEEQGGNEKAEYGTGLLKELSKQMTQDFGKVFTVTNLKFYYIAVRGQGNPNIEDGEYKKAIGLLYGIAFTIKMSKKGEHQIDGYFDYVVPPLEGFWWQDGVTGIDYAHKENFKWISVIRLPDFVTKADFDWAIEEAANKKNKDFTKVEFLTYDEGLCVQCMHIGSYDDEPATVALMHEFMEQQRYALDITDERLHHEIYLSDARKVAPERLKTVIRHPIKKA